MEFLGLSGMLFWFFVLVTFIMCEFTVVRESHLSLLWLGIFAFILYWGYHINVVTWTANNFSTAVIYTLSYLGIGLLWGFIKWTFHLKNARDDIMKNEVGYRRQYETAKLPPNAFEGSFTDYLEGSWIIPVAATNKEKISVWMIWWPFSLFWTLLHDIVGRMYDALIKHYLFLFDRINKMIFGSLNR
jgi:hypothetical protein